MVSLEECSGMFRNILSLSLSLGIVRQQGFLDVFIIHHYTHNYNEEGSRERIYGDSV